MTHPQLGTEQAHWIDGTFVEDDVLRVARKVNEYDPRLRVQYLEYAASLGDPPFRVVEHCKDGVDRTVLYAWTLDDRILQRIAQADTQRIEVLANIDKQNAQAKKDAQRRYQEMKDDLNEQAIAILKSPKDTYIAEVNGRKVKISTTEPPRELNRTHR